MAAFENEIIRMREFQSVEFPIMLAQRRAKQVELARRTVALLRLLEAKREVRGGGERGGEG